MGKWSRRDWFNIAILTVFFLGMVFFLTRGGFLYGSRVDWESQHIAFPEYFRTLFYETGNIFPDFAFNIGAGQNIYNFAYYGFLSPFILLSYLFPFISMTYYLIGVAILVVIISTILFYKFLKSFGFGNTTLFSATLLFMFSTSLTMHSHRHIMFMIYMPFVLLGLMGVDKYLTNKKSFLLSVSVFLMIMTSFYYSISGILCLIIYGIYRYIILNKKIQIKTFLKDGVSFLIPIFIGILLSGILIIPTFNVLLTNRSATNVDISLTNLFFPTFKFDFLLYNSYGVGLSIIALIALIYLFFRRKMSDYFLGITLGLFLIFPIFNYILNGMMYIDGKIFIPFLPLYAYVTAIFINDLMKVKFRVKKYLLVPILILSFLISYNINSRDALVEKEKFIGERYQNIKQAINYLTQKDKTMYRTAILVDKLQNINRVFNNINYYHANVYSSTSNMIYNRFFYDTVHNPIQMRNRAITAGNHNLLFNMFIGNKYLLSLDANAPLGYRFFNNLNDIYVYKNEDVLPIAYASSNLFSRKNFERLGYPYNMEMFINGIITEEKSNTYFHSNIGEIALGELPNLSEFLEIKEENGIYYIDTDRNIKFNYELDESFKNHIIFIRFNVLASQNCSYGDLRITINETKNTLTCQEWKYHNGNYQFDYAISIKDNLELNIDILKGRYEIVDLEFYVLNIEYIQNIREDIDEFIFNKDKTKGNVIYGSINVTESGYFAISIPYDRGFNFYVNGVLTPYEKVNTAFMGFPVEEGYHEIRIVYNAPLKRTGMFISLIGLFALLGMTLKELLYETNLNRKNNSKRI